MKLKFIIFILPIILLAPNSLSAANSPEADFAKGNELYSQGNFAAAIESYEGVRSQGMHSWSLYYNLGNAYYRQQEFGNAILNYKKALKLNPGNKEIKQNLDLAESKTEDQIKPIPELFLRVWWHNIVSLCSPTGWLIWSIISLALFVVAFAIGKLRIWPHPAVLRGGLIMALLSLVLLTLFLTCFKSAQHHITSANEAIVTQPFTMVMSSPEHNSVEKMTLHEGTTVTIQETVGDWYKIQIADGNSGWLHRNDITPVTL